jgi:uncharacterized protein involved in exopolysaccharide biosynthesis
LLEKTMAQDDESLDRLEAALDRIARRVEQTDPVEAEVAGRLDAVISRLRAGLAPQTGAVPVDGEEA